MRGHWAAASLEPDRSSSQRPQLEALHAFTLTCLPIKKPFLVWRLGGLASTMKASKNHFHKVPIMNMPTDLSPETAAWMRVQMTLAAARAVEPLRAEINKVDDWANGLFLVLNDLLPFLLRTHPELASELAPRWRTAAESFDRIQEGQAAEPDEPLELLEARKMLFRMNDLFKLWPAAVKQKSVRVVPRMRRA